MTLSESWLGLICPSHIALPPDDYIYTDYSLYASKSQRIVFFCKQWRVVVIIEINDLVGFDKEQMGFH